MKRERQKLQYFNRWDNDEVIAFAPDSEAIEVLKMSNFKETITVPGRREGWLHSREIAVRKLAAVAWFESFDEFSAASRSQVYHDMADTWVLEEMPDAVQSAYAAWINSDLLPSDANVRQVLHEIAVEPTDRMTATGDCSHCPNDERYACYTSGWSRQLYRYPLVRVKAAGAHQVYEVPLDSALLVDCHPESLVYQARPKFSVDGRMSADFIAEINVGVVSSDYISTATDGKILPQEDTFEVINGGRFEMCIAEWSEEGGSAAAQKVDPRSLAGEFQDVIMMAHVERVSDVNYNTVLADISHKLGRHGLTLALQSTTQFGEPSSRCMILTDSHSVLGDPAEDGDMYGALEKMKRRTEAM